MSHNFWHPTLEQCGFILKNQDVVFIGNLSRNPEVSFEISEKDIEKIGFNPKTKQSTVSTRRHIFKDYELPLGDDYSQFIQTQFLLDTPQA